MSNHHPQIAPDLSEYTLEDLLKEVGTRISSLEKKKRTLDDAAALRRWVPKITLGAMDIIATKSAKSVSGRCSPKHLDRPTGGQPDPLRALFAMGGGSHAGSHK